MGLHPGLLVESNAFSSEATISHFVNLLYLVDGFSCVLLSSSAISPEKADVRVACTVSE